MMIFHAILMAVVLVTLGYLCSWASMHENTSKGLAGFGKVMATILYIFAALVLVFGLSYNMHCKRGMPCKHGMMGNMEMSMHEGTGMHGMGMRTMKEEMKEWKMNNPKEWKECVDELNKAESK